VLNCKIANVVASIEPDALLSEVLADYKVTIGNSRGSLEFTADNATTAHGYFMQPNGDTSLTWTITGKRENGQDYVKKGTIFDVKPAHEYVLKVKYTPDPNDYGGAFITVTVDDSELVIDDIIQIKGAPVFSGIGYDISKPVEGAPGKFDLTAEGANEALDGMTHYPVADFDKIDDAATIMHGMLANNFTGAAYKVTADAQKFADDFKAGLATTHWMCGIPEKYIVVQSGDYVMTVYGNGQLVDAFKTKALEVLTDSTILAEGNVAA
jgi:hypothetical protein